MSTLGVGGNAEVFLEPSKTEDVSTIFRIRAARSFPLYILGGGTNVVFTDGLVKGVVLSTRRLKDFWWNAEGEQATLDAECGYPLPLAVSESAKKGLTGAEFAQGIPGTIGGAVTGNAGAGGRSVGDLLVELTTVEGDGSVKKWKRGEFSYSYRYFSLTSYSALPSAASYAVPERLFISCKMKFQRAAFIEIERNVNAFRQVRARQPHGAKSAGCAFKNPGAESAGRLLDICGCKGLRVGGAVVSESHANFLLNTGDATGTDIFELMESCRDIVFRRTGIRLEPEIKFLGFAADLFFV